MEELAIQTKPCRGAPPGRRTVLCLAGAIAGLLVSVGIAAGAGRAPNGQPTHGGAVVSASDLGIYAVNVDGTGLTRVTRDGYDSDAVWSPDATRIAFTRPEGTKPTAVMVVKPDGRGLRQIGHGIAPEWSPDGTRVAFRDDNIVFVDITTGEEGTRPTGFTVVKADGTGARRIESGEISTLEWSPDGTRIAYVVKKDQSLRLLDLRNGVTTRLATVPSRERASAWGVAVAWSPDGRQLAVDDGRTLALLGPAVTGKRKLAALADGRPGLAWSPDGRQVAVHDGEGLALVDVARRRLTKLTRQGEFPDWSPDGTRIAFVRLEEDNVRQVLTIGRDGRGERRLDSSTTFDDVLGWCPNGMVVYSRPRSGGDGSDIWAIGGGGLGKRAVTRAFPTGARFESPQCAAATIPVRPATPTPTLSLSPAHLLTTKRASNLAADGPRAAVVTGDGVALWDPAGGLSPLDLRGGELAVAGNRVAAIYRSYEMITDFLEVATPGAKAVSVDYAVEKYTDEWLGNLAGDGELLVYNKLSELEDSSTRMELRRIVGTTTELVTAGADAQAVYSVDAGRIAVLRGDGELVLLDPEGRRLSAFQLGTKGIGGVTLTGSRLVARRGTVIEVRDAARGTLLHRWPTRGGDLAPVGLSDASGDFAVYTAGIAIHLLRLSDGRDRLLALPNEEGPADAELEPEGLYYFYNRPGSARPGRFAFVPSSELDARL